MKQQKSHTRKLVSIDRLKQAVLADPVAREAYMERARQLRTKTRGDARVKLEAKRKRLKPRQ